MIGLFIGNDARVSASQVTVDFLAEGGVATVTWTLFSSSGATLGTGVMPYAVSRYSGVIESSVFAGVTPNSIGALRVVYVDGGTNAEFYEDATFTRRPM